MAYFALTINVEPGTGTQSPCMQRFRMDLMLSSGCLAVTWWTLADHLRHRTWNPTTRRMRSTYTVMETTGLACVPRAIYPRREPRATNHGADVCPPKLCSKLTMQSRLSHLTEMSFGCHLLYDIHAVHVVKTESRRLILY